MLWNKLELDYLPRNLPVFSHILDSIVVSIPACHAGDRGSIPRRGDFYVSKYIYHVYYYFLMN